MTWTTCWSFANSANVLGEEEGQQQAKHYGRTLFPLAAHVYVYPLGDKYEVVTVHHA
jgi:hypothetical protein